MGHAGASPEVSLIYLVLIERVLDGVFELGRFTDLVIGDVVIFLLMVIAGCEVWRVRRLARR